LYFTNETSSVVTASKTDNHQTAVICSSLPPKTLIISCLTVTVQQLIRMPRIA